MPEVDLRELRQLWHDNPPAVVVMFGVVFFAVWYRLSNEPSVSSLLYLATGLLLIGVLWEALWLMRRHARSTNPPPPERVRKVRWGLAASIAIWLLLLAITFAELYAPGERPTAVATVLFLGVFGAYPVAILGAVFVVARRLRRRESGERGSTR